MAAPRLPSGARVAEFLTTQPASPPAGTGVVLFTRRRGRAMLAMVDAVGHDTTLQPHLLTNRFASWIPQYGTATVNQDALPATFLSAGAAAPGAVTPTAGSVLAQAGRVSIASTATAGTGGSARGSVAPYYLSSTAQLGGFDLKVRFGFPAVPATGSRFFVGMHTALAQIIASANTSALLNMVGVGWDASDTPALILMNNDASGTATRLATGIALNANEQYELTLFAASGGGLRVDWGLRAITLGTLAQGTLTTDLPAVSTMLTPHLAIANGALASAQTAHLVGMSCEVDN